MTDNHALRVVGPWYRWMKPGDPRTGRSSAPVLQKYASADPVSEFLANPQRSLKFVDDDFVYEVTTLASAQLADGRRKRFSDLLLKKTTTRKIFLPTHRRFYLVVCEVHCDVPGFPRADRGEICEAGFVVRRRSAVMSKEARPEAKRILHRMATLSHGLARTAAAVADRHAGPVAATGVRALARIAAAARDRRSVGLASDLADAKARLASFAIEHDVTVILEGWIPSKDHDKIGSWATVEESPEKLVEATFPLYPLVPDPRDAKHSGRGRCLYFGVLPALVSDTDVQGQPRFDDRTLYEVRCFVRRHKAGCPRKAAGRDCSGPLFFSEPTESYRLAPHFDTVGTANRPVTIQLPDLQALEAEASRPITQLAPVRFSCPEGSCLEAAVDGDMKPVKPGSKGGPSICSFSIPLITIVAMFVLNLFLPIVMLVFGLWFLLRLRFCIPPELSVSAGAAVALRADLNLKLSVALEAGIDVNFDADLAAAVGLDIDANFGAEVGAELRATYAPSALIELTNAATLAGVAQPVGVGVEPPAPLDLTASLVFEESVEVSTS